jgi:hypothetical protein
MSNSCNWLPLLTPFVGKLWLVQEDKSVGSWRVVSKQDIDSNPMLAGSFREWLDGI